MLALPSWGCLARVGCECNVISGASVHLHKPYTNTYLIAAVCLHGPSKQNLSAGEGCFTAWFKTALQPSP